MAASVSDIMLGYGDRHHLTTDELFDLLCDFIAQQGDNTALEDFLANQEAGNIRETLVAEIRATLDLKDADGHIVLDDLVHDIKAEEAAAINSEGVDAQLYFLLAEDMTKDEIITAVRNSDDEP